MIAVSCQKLALTYSQVSRICHNRSFLLTLDLKPGHVCHGTEGSGMIKIQSSLIEIMAPYTIGSKNGGLDRE